MVSPSLITNHLTFMCTLMPHCRDGGVFGPFVFVLPLGHQFQYLLTAQLEMLNVVVFLKVWSQLWANQKVKIFCDNQVVQVYTGKAKDPFLATCARNVWLITAILNIEIIVIHVPDKNPIADLLSRWVTTVNPELRQWWPDFIWINTHTDLTKLNVCI